MRIKKTETICNKQGPYSLKIMQINLTKEGSSCTKNDHIAKKYIKKFPHLSLSKPIKKKN